MGAAEVSNPDKKGVFEAHETCSQNDAKYCHTVNTTYIKNFRLAN